MVYQIAYEREADITAVDWKAAAESWPMWYAENCDADLLVEQSAKRLKLSAYVARMWQEGVTARPTAPEDFGLYTPVPDKCVVIALEVLRGARAPAPIFDVEEDIADLDLESDIFGTPGDVKTLMVSDVGSSAWKAIKKTAGISLQAVEGSFPALHIRPSQPFAWDSETQLPQACSYMPHIKENIRTTCGNQGYVLYDMQQESEFLSVTGMVSLLGCNITGTSDIGLVMQSFMVAGRASNGTRWIWHVKPPMTGAATGPDDEGESSDVENDSDAKAVADAFPQDPNLLAWYTKYAPQAKACLLLANIHAPYDRPIVTLTDLQDHHIMYWLDGRTLLYYIAPDAARAWALTRALLKAYDTFPEDECESSMLQQFVNRKQWKCHK